MGQLKTTLVAAAGSEPGSWVAVLHGIYGAGRNWRSVVQSVVEEREEWGGVLVDLRQHGESRGFTPPHTLEATAADLEGVEVPGRLRALLGHSFGGKVALLRGREDERVEQLWVIDSTPESREPAGSAWEMLRVLRRLPESFEDRDAAVEALVEAGVARAVALWMTTNLEWREDCYRWRLDVDTMEALLQDFFRTDLWDVVESPREGLEIHFVRASESSVLGLDALERIRSAGRSSGRVFVHEVSGGHWLNSDNPEAIRSLLSTHLPTSPSD